MIVHRRSPGWRCALILICIALALIDERSATKLRPASDDRRLALAQGVSIAFARGVRIHQRLRHQADYLEQRRRRCRSVEDMEAFAGVV
jgi:hypothetical protein